jgi:hypothetical protein
MGCQGQQPCLDMTDSQPALGPLADGQLLDASKIERYNDPGYAHLGTLFEDCCSLYLCQLSAHVPLASGRPNSVVEGSTSYMIPKSFPFSRSRSSWGSAYHNRRTVDS